MEQSKNITIVGAGNVGMSLGAVLAKEHNVIFYEEIMDKVNLINRSKSTIADDDIDQFIKIHELSIEATTDCSTAFRKADFILICVPTNFDEVNHSLDTSIIDEVVNEALTNNSKATIIIKSTVPVGYSARLQKRYRTDKIIFSPEFLREGTALYDNLNPSRIIVGNENESANIFAQMLYESADNNPEILMMSSSDAEAVKLFSNTFLAMRVAYFNELDTFSIAKGLSPLNIIKGVTSDPRIGEGYNNPSFGYGGYCLPKDTKQLLSNFGDLPQTIIQAAISSNQARKEFISEDIIKLKPKTVGIYRLTMKSSSSNFRSSAIIDIMNNISRFVEEVIIYEPLVMSSHFMEFRVIKDFEEFKALSGLIIANRKTSEIADVSDRVYCRDIFEED